MKRALILILFAFVTAYAVNAQDLTSKKGTPILPEKGDYSFSIDAVPFFVYLGNMFHGSDQTQAPTFDFPGLNDVPMWTVQLKKFVSPTLAMRARIRLGFMTQTLKNTILDQTNTSSTPAYVDDKWTVTKMNIVLGAGMEQRRGKGRVQGVWGAMANIMLGTHANKLTYGNELSSSYPTPLSTDYPWTKSETGTGYYTSHTNNRVVADNEGTTFGFGVNSFLGVEYFFAPKMSIGGEFTWGLMIQFTGKSKNEIEYLNGSPALTKTTETTKSGGSMYFGIDNGNTGGAINLNFYF